MFNKLVLSALVSATMLSSAVEARPLCGFWKTTTVYDYEQVETEMDYTTCRYSGYTNIWARSDTGKRRWFNIHESSYNELANHVTCSSSTTVSINRYEYKYEFGVWERYWIFGSASIPLSSQQHKTDIQVTNVRIEGSGRQEQVWFAGTNDGEPECEGRGEGPGEF